MDMNINEIMLYNAIDTELKTILLKIKEYKTTSMRPKIQKFENLFNSVYSNKPYAVQEKVLELLDYGESEENVYISIMHALNKILRCIIKILNFFYNKFN